MQYTKTLNAVQPLLMAFLVTFALVFNTNGKLWDGMFNAIYCTYTLLISSALYVISKKTRLQLQSIDFIICAILLLSAFSRALRLHSIYDGTVIASLTLLVYYLGLKHIRFATVQKALYYTCIVCIGSALCLYCLLEYFYIIEPKMLHWRFTGNFSNPGPLGCFLALTLSFCALKFYENSTILNYKNSLLYGSATVLHAIVIVLSASRIAMSSGLFISALLVYKHIKRRKYFVYLISLGVCIAIAIMFSKGFGSVQGRLLIWKIALGIIKDNPLFGIGYQFFEADYPNYQAAYFTQSRSTQDVFLAVANTRAFNAFLKFSAEHGVLGILLGSTGIAYLLRSNKHLNSRSKNTTVHVLFFVALFCIINASYSLNFFPVKLLVLHQLALIPFHSKNKMTGAKCIPLGIYVSGCIVIMLLNTHYHKGVTIWQDAFYTETKAPDKAKIRYKEANAYLPSNGILAYYNAAFLYDKAPVKALKLTKKSLKTFNTPAVNTLYAQLNASLKQDSIAALYYTKTCFMQPHLFKPKARLLDFYKSRNDTLKQKETAKHILNTPVKIKSKTVTRIKQNAKLRLKQLSTG